MATAAHACAGAAARAAPAARAEADAANAAARKVAHAAGFAQRRRIAVAGLGVCIVTLALSGYAAAFLLPHPPKGMGWTSIPRADAGVTLSELAQIAALAAAFSAAILGLQQFALRPLFGAREATTTEAVFFASSLLVRCGLLAVLGYHHFGPGRHDIQALGDAGHRLPAVAVFYAAYSTDLFQLIWRRREFTPSYPKMVIPHHWISLAFFGAWTLFFAPRGAAGAPNWNTNIVYLTCCMPVHLFKLVTTYYRPWWTPFAVWPMLCVHWALLLGSQWYLFATCPCSAHGCWYTGSVWMFVGGWGIVFYTLHDRFNSIVLGCSKALGNPVTFYDCPRLILGYDIASPAPKAAPVKRAGTPRASAAGGRAGAAGAAAEGEGAPVTVELVFRAAAPRGGAAKGAPEAAGAARAQRGAAGALVAALAAAVRTAAAPGRKWKPACVAAFEDEDAGEGAGAGEGEGESKGAVRRRRAGIAAS